MDKEKVVKIMTRWGLPILWRLALVVTVLLLVVNVGNHLLLDALFNGPSESYRDSLALTLLASGSDLPAKYLDSATLDKIQAAANAACGTSDPGLVNPISGNAVESATHVLKSATATVEFPHTAPGILGRGSHFWGINHDHILVLSDIQEGLSKLGITDIQSCGAILMLDGQPNTALLERSGHAAFAALGQDKNGTLIFVTTTGGTKDAPGATYRDLLNIMQEYGAVNACILSENYEEG